jgi:predicted GIY-YIG superfamily endonuclease
MAIVYKITNKINGKIYFGLTTRTLKQRFDSHLSAVRQGSKFRFHSAIRKYGVDSWDLEIAAESDDMNFIRKKEEELILEYNTTNSTFGYNAKPGGCGGWIVKPENYEKWCENNRISAMGEKNTRFNGVTNDELYQLVKEESIKLGYIPSSRHMIKNYYPKFPKSFNGYRFDGSYKNLVDILQKEIYLKFNPYEKTDEHRENLSKANRGKKWFNDGQNSIQCFPDKVPDGFKPGRLKSKG